MAPGLRSLLQAGSTHGQQEIDAESLLAELCTPPRSSSSGKTSRISSEKFVEIAALLEGIGGLAWSIRPRTYTVLRNIARLDLLDHFASQGLTDFDLPYSERTLPDFINERSIRKQFLIDQQYVLTDARLFEEPGGAHISIDGYAKQYFYFKRHLGQGGFGAVDEVVSRLSLKSYARKRVLRGNNSERNRRAQKYLVEELTTLKALSQRHLVCYVGSYTDKEHIAFLMEPVADCDLRAFLDSIPQFPGRLASLRYFFGCLSGAVNYLHTKGIRHRDLKSSNILVKDGQVFVTDFGTAYNTAKTKRSTTLDGNVPQSIQYIAPEVAKSEARSMSSDMWSLGVVFLEMSTVLLGKSLRLLNAYIEKSSRARKSQRYVWDNIDATYDWLDSLRRDNKGPQQDNEVLTWTRILLKAKQNERLTSVQLMQRISESPSFNSFCCFQCCPQFERSSFTLTDVQNENSYISISEVDDQVTTLFQGAALNHVSSMEDERKRTIQDWITSTDAEIGTTSSFSTSETNSESVEQSSLNFAIKQDTTHEPGHDDDKQSEGGDSISSSVESFYSLTSHTKRPPSTSVTMGTTKHDTPASVTNQLFPTTDNKGMHGIWDSMPIIEHNPWADDADETLPDNKSTAGLRELDTRSTEKDGTRDVELHDSGTQLILRTRREHHGQKASSAYQVAETNLQETREGLPSISPTPTGEDRYTVVQKGCTESPASEVASNSTKEDNSPSLDLIPLPKPLAHFYVQGSATPGLIKKITRKMPKPLPKEVHEGDDVETSDHLALIPSSSNKGLSTVKNNRTPKVEKSITPIDQEPTSIENKGQGRGIEIQNRITGNITNAKSEKLSLLNMALHNSAQKKSDAAANSDKNKKPYSYFNPQVYMETTWEAASTQITEKQDLQDMKLTLWKWWDRDGHYLEAMCRQGKAPAVRRLLSEGCNPGTIFKPRPLPLILAVKGGTPQHYKCVQALIKAGVDVNVAEPKTRKTALKLAIELPNFKGHTNLVRDIAVSGAKINVADASGEMPIHSIFRDSDSTPLAKFRLDALACILRVDIYGDTDVNVCDRHDLNSPLHLAVRRNSSMAVGMLLYKGADVNKKNSIGITPLLMATTQWAGRLSENQEAVLELLLRSPDINVNESGGFEKQTALHQAVLHASPSATRMLLESKADPSIRDSQGRNAQDLALGLDGTKWKEEKEEILAILGGLTTDGDDTLRNKH